MSLNHYADKDQERIAAAEQLKERVFEANGIKLAHAVWKTNGVTFSHLYHNKRRIVVHYVNLMKTGNINVHDVNFNATPLAEGIKGTERSIGTLKNTQAKEYEAWYIECMKDSIEFAKGTRPTV